MLYLYIMYIACAYSTTFYFQFQHYADQDMQVCVNLGMEFHER